jgi:hypothetical protein
MPFKKGERVKGANIFPKGVSGNPKGRPKKLPNLNELLKEVLGKEDAKGKTEAQLILEALKTRAKRGDVRAAEVLLDRGYGKVKDNIDVNMDVNAKIKTVQVIQLPDNGRD